MITSGQQIAKALNYRTHILLEAPATKDIQRKCGHYKEIYNTFSPIKASYHISLPTATPPRVWAFLVSGLR